jgi:PAS domain S-box-containing protein
MKDTLKIIFIEDVETDAELIWRELDKNKIIFKKLLVDNRKDYLEGLKSFNPDLIISDYSLPMFDGMKALLLRNELTPDTPFILITGSNNEEIAVECMKSGAEDYILKDNLARLGPAIKNTISKIRILREKKKAEEAINQERRMLRTLIDNLPDPIYVMDEECRKVIANKADVINIGFENENEVLGKNDIELFPGMIGIRGQADNEAVVNSGKAIIEREEYFIDKKGVKRWLQTTKIPLHDKDGKITGLVGIGHDITSRKQAEAELLQSHEFSNSLLRTIPFGMDIVDESGNILFQSENLRDMFGEAALGMKCWELYRDDKTQCSDCPLTKGIIIGKTEAYESHGVLGDRIFEINHTGMMYQGKKAMLEIFLDITDRKRNEKELVLAKEKAEESDRLKTAFLHNISHEIRTPMNAIVGFSALLDEPDINSETRHSYVEMIMQSSNNLLSIINDILDVANIEANLVKIVKSEINLNSVFRTLYEQFLIRAREKNLSLSLDYGLADTDALIITDNAKLLQILSNLINNAIKFTNQGGIKMEYKVQEGFLKFTISDSGIGISSDHQQRIFDRFYQVKNSMTRTQEGTGLGLSISKAYVELLNGKIWVSSIPEKGTTFYFTIPYEKNVAGGESESGMPVSESFIFSNKKTILIAEDLESNFFLIRYFLSKANTNVLRAVNGREAVDIALANKDIDLILMDIKMPEMDGLTATKIIRETNVTVPIIAQTAYVDERDRAIESGCSGFISKPFDKKGLFKVLREYF